MGLKSGTVHIFVIQPLFQTGTKSANVFAASLSSVWWKLVSVISLFLKYGSIMAPVVRLSGNSQQ